MYGFKRYDLPLLVSYPRSGTNWIRYFMETMTEQPTPGSERTLTGNDYCIDRAHAGWKVMGQYSKVILVLRDYRECIIRQQGIERVHRYSNIEKFLNGRLFKQPPNWYIRNIQKFDEFTGKKLLLYYEDMVKNPEDPFRELAQLMGIEQEKVSSFFENLEEHKKGSIAAYTKKKHTSETQGKSGELGHHSKQLTTEENQAFDEYYQKGYTVLFERYLKRYSSSE